MRAELVLDGAAELREDLLAVERRVKGSKLTVLEEIAERFAGSVRERVRAGLSPPLTETTIRLRGGGATPLIGGQPLGKHSTGVGTILGNIAARAGERGAGVYVDDYRARFHQFGFRTSPESAIPGKEVPARPFVWISEADADWAMERYADFIFGAGQ